MVLCRGHREPFPFARARGCWGADSLQSRLPFGGCQEFPAIKTDSLTIHSDQLVSPILSLVPRQYCPFPSAAIPANALALHHQKEGQ
jgi:hypothetical protein